MEQNDTPQTATSTMRASITTPYVEIRSPEFSACHIVEFDCTLLELIGYIHDLHREKYPEQYEYLDDYDCME